MVTPIQPSRGNRDGIDSVSPQRCAGCRPIRSHARTCADCGARAGPVTRGKSDPIARAESVTGPIDFGADLATVHTELKPSSCARFASDQRPNAGTTVTVIGYAVQQTKSRDAFTSSGTVLNASWLGIFGNCDENPNADQVNRTEAELKRLGKGYEFYRYDGAGHAFFNTARVSYRPEQAADGWAKVFKFLQTHLAA